MSNIAQGLGTNVAPKNSIPTRLFTRLLYAADSFSARVSAQLALAYVRTHGVSHARTIKSYTSPNELRALLKLALECPLNARGLEIGSHLGASAVYLASGLAKRGGKLYCVDTWQNHTMPEGEQDTWAEFKKNTAGVSDYVVPIRAWSTQVDRSVIDPPLSLLFIDGDHSYEAVKADFEYYRDLLSANPTIAFHDSTSYPGVARFTGELLASGEWMIGGHVESLLWIRRARWSRAC